MKALWKNDWYRMGRKMLLVLTVLFAATVLSYESDLARRGSHYIIRNMESNRILWHFYSQIVSEMDRGGMVIWVFTLATVWLTGKLMHGDRRSGWHQLCRAMPLTAWQYITEKYLFGLVFMGGSMALVMLCQTVYVLRIGVFDGWFLMLFFLRYMAVFLLWAALLNVVTFRWGFGTALLWAGLTYWLVPSLLSLLLDNSWSGYRTYTGFRFSHLIEWVLYQPKGIVVFAAVAAGVYILSYVLCLLFAERQWRMCRSQKTPKQSTAMA